MGCGVVHSGLGVAVGAAVDVGALVGAGVGTGVTPPQAASKSKAITPIRILTPI
ncbi:MAG: hypothetical protein HY867_20740 [Chloroflexi bacterium]|nr:hypothetical protein [Chloroflexota bacterium]